MASRSSAKSKSSARREARPSDHPQLFAATEESQESGALRVMYRLPERFEAFSDPQQGMVVIKDTQSGKKVPVAIGAYGEVRRLLGALFGGDVEEVTDFVPPAVEPLSAEQIESFEAAESEAAETARLAAEVRETKAPAPPPFPPETIADIPPPPKKLFGAALKAYEARMRKAMEAAPSQPETAPAAPQASAPAKAASKKGARADAPTEKADAPQNTATAETAKPEKAASQKKSDVKAEDAPKPSIVPVSVTGQKPAVPVRQSVQPDHIVCLEDGEKMKMLKRHLRTSYNMSPEEYKAKWGLPANYPMVAPNYAKQKSLYARKVGLGTHRMRDEVAQKKAVAED